MPVITLQLGQCGNQLGSSFFGALATEFSSYDYGTEAVHEYYRPGEGATYTARAVLIDMEPKVVAGARSAAASSGSWWRYPASGYLVQQSGSGNNWAQGFHGYGPSVRDAALELVRREVEAADSLTGFLLLQSMAGGTGAGLGTYVAEALRDEYHSSFVTNCCVWPYESGEVIVQPYNTLFTLSHLADVSDGIILLENEALHRTAARGLGIARPSFGDMNGIAARALSSVLLPSQPRGPYANGSHSPAPAGAPSHHARGGPGSVPGSVPGTPGSGSGVQLPALRRNSSSSGNRAGEADSGLYGRLRQMLVTGSVLEEGMDWSVTPRSPGAGQGGGGTTTAGSAPAGGPPAGSPAMGGGGAAAVGVPRVNRAVANWLVLRGQGAADVDVAEFADPALTAPWAVDPLAVSQCGARFGRCLMAASLLSNDRRCVGPIQRMQEKAYGMLESRAFVHQYEKYGMSVSDFQACFARIEDIAQRYGIVTVPLAAAAARDPEGLALRPEAGPACELARQRRREAYSHVFGALRAVMTGEGAVGAGAGGAAAAAGGGGGGSAALSPAERSAFKNALLK
ncbi:UNI3 protein [Gonium pectorale]|uniref:Tubulin delta chain n=1 Tax=Gonium pectorale TaxID=33097 RepID=A0A150H484_GONPE|nr:UNI3 protein [Gonium pectorale]|eukprot:KXZ56936.1 UNI3 protein [Gonium pectorale]